MSYANKHAGYKNNIHSTQQRPGCESRTFIKKFKKKSSGPAVWTLSYATLTQSMGNMRQCSMIPATAPANMWVQVEAPCGKPS